MAVKLYKRPPVPQTPAAQRKKKKVFHEWGQGTLHMGKTGKVVPKSRPDIAQAIALSSARKVAKRGD